ncbi:MAG: class I SAM-dependent methyltransferase [Cyanobacteria bacterium J06639_1]
MPRSPLLRDLHSTATELGKTAIAPCFTSRTTAAQFNQPDASDRFHTSIPIPISSRHSVERSGSGVVSLRFESGYAQRFAALRECAWSSPEAIAMADGAWFQFFQTLGDPVFNDKRFAVAERRYEALHEGFIERHLDPNGDPILALGAGYGLIEIPLARRGYSVIAIDNDEGVLEVLSQNAKYAEGNLTVAYGDLSADFEADYRDRPIQACISFGLLEHFPLDKLRDLIRKQFAIAPLLICDIPVRSPETLKTFQAESQPEGHVDEFGIYRNFWTPDYWQQVVFEGYEAIATRQHSEPRQDGRIDAITLFMRDR